MTYSKTINTLRIYKAKTLVLKYTADFHYTRIYNHHRYLTPKRVQYPQNLCPLTSHPSFHPHSLPATTLTLYFCGLTCASLTLLTHVFAYSLKNVG